MRRKKMSPRQRFRLFRSLAILAGTGVLAAAWIGGRQGLPPAAPALPAVHHAYYRDADGLLLVPVNRAERLAPPAVVPAAEPEAQAAGGEHDHPGVAWLNELRASYPERGLYSALPPGTRVVGVRQEGDLVEATLQLGTDASPGARAEALLAGAVGQTLADLPGARRIKIDLRGPSGPLQQRLRLDFARPLTAAEWLGTWRAADEDYDGGPACTVYWRVPAETLLAPVLVPVKGSAGLDGCLQAWSRGPDQARRRYVDPAAPAGWKFRLVGAAAPGNAVAVVEVTLPRGVAWSHPAPRAYLRTVLPALTLTLTELPGVKAVRVVTRDAPPAGAVAGYNVDQPVPRPAAINRL